MDEFGIEADSLGPSLGDDRSHVSTPSQPNTFFRTAEFDDVDIDLSAADLPGLKDADLSSYMIRPQQAPSQRDRNQGGFIAQRGKQRSPLLVTVWVVALLFPFAGGFAMYATAAASLIKLTPAVAAIVGLCSGLITATVFGVLLLASLDRRDRNWFGATKTR